MFENNRNDAFMDVLGIMSFAMSILNYNENIDQSTLQNIAKNIMQDIHKHLQEQDRKIDEILDILKREGLTNGVPE